MAEETNLPLQCVRRKKRHQLSEMLFGQFLWTLMFLQLTTHALCADFSHCGEGRFDCMDGSCILLEKMCDGRHDCTDNSDELNCDSQLCRQPYWFKCSETDGTCISSDLFCNGIENCPSGEDEFDCMQSKSPSNGYSSSDVGVGGWHLAKRKCSSAEFQCQTDGSCIPLDFMCDGKNDCRDGSDEAVGCQKAQESCKGFFCSNNKCLESTKWHCDGVDDCGDGSDERDCALSCKPELGQFSCQNNKTCIELSKVCDGSKDCPGGSDESPKCTSTTDNCANHKCPPASTCHMFPLTGPGCVCPKGYRLSTQQMACVDIDECAEEFGICSQHCKNVAGSYRCLCDEGYKLSANGKSCEALGEDALLLYSTQVAVAGVYLKSKRIFTVARNLTKVIGLSYDGKYMYWTNIQNEAESIVKSNLNGTDREILLTSGLDAPEDLAIDWLTGNIYFSDNIMRHIAVCSNDGIHCTALVTTDVHQPRGVALWPERAEIYWTDWGLIPTISRASMDGRDSNVLVKENIHWPNGIALDMHNDRIYWVDAKLSTMESVRSDGSDRHVVLDEILKHPYGIAVFEDRLYWSDWATKSIHSCNKFSGKDHKVVAKDRTIYAVHIYHSAKQPKFDHACMHKRCSHLCLLAAHNSSTCACPDGMKLSTDQLRCVKTRKKQRLILGINNNLLEIEHTNFGRHRISKFHELPLLAHKMVYNNVHGTIILVDNIQHGIYEYDGQNKNITTLVQGNLGNITAMEFDPLSYNLYWADSERHVVEVLSLQTHQRAIVSFFSGLEIPIGLAVIPEDGIMFVALSQRRQIHIDRLPLSGVGERHHVFEDELGSDYLEFATDYGTQTLYWSDSNLGRISFTDYRNLNAYTFRGRLRRPYSIAIVEDDLFWSEKKSGMIYWTHKSNLGPMKRIEIEPPRDRYNFRLPQEIPLLATTPAMIIDHPCQHANGGCSHVCVALGKSTSGCLCPAGRVFKDASNRTCIDSLDCEFRCRSGECLTLSHRCNGRRDCPDGTDEEHCDTGRLHRKKVVCSLDEFMCHDSEECIKQMKRCDDRTDCRDGSDEEHCERFDKSKQCHRHQHACDNGNCVDFSVMCDDVDDCGDNSDETNCNAAEDKNAGASRLVQCEKDMFQCNTGTCIASSWECDGKLDCIDGSDEHEKCVLKECSASMHRCLFGQCIDAQLVCDGHNDCGDYSDEVNCDSSSGQKRKIICGDENHRMFQCRSDETICLELSATCNGTAECPRGEDEADCGAICSIYEFQCKTNKDCIRMEFRCDHDKDCLDGSDEMNCERGSRNDTALATNTHERPCEANMYDCRDGQCVDLTRVCDGFLDCETGRDEGPLCKTACKSSSRNDITCSHKCRPTPAGAVCSCFHGYKLDADKRTCVDINECEEIDPCAQVCENNLGSYRCSCFPDFMLRPDKTTCKSIESESSLMFSTYNEVRSMTEQPITLRVVWSANDSKITGFDLNVRERIAYFSTADANLLYRVDLKTGQVKDGLSVEMPMKVAVDWITGNVYVISRASRYGIKVCSFAVKMCGLILQFGSSDIAKTVTVDAYNRRLFVVVARSQSFGLPISDVIISSLDGKNRQTLLNKNGHITATACDPHKKMLYFLDSHSRTLQAISYGLRRSRTPTTILQKSNVITHPSGLTVYEHQAFIVNIGSKEVTRCNLYGSRECKAFNLSILNAEDILVDGASRQPVQNNPCTMAKCSGMCVMAEFSYECMCENSIVAEENHCPKSSTNEILASGLPENGANSKKAKSTASHLTAIILIVFLLILIASLFGYFYYRRVKQGHRDFNINLHFQNPLSSAANKFSKSERFMPAHTFPRNEGEGIIFETLKGKELRGLATARDTPSIILENDSDCDPHRTDGPFYDDARARLVS